MADGLANDVMERLSQMMQARSQFEVYWNQIRDVAVPEAQEFSQQSMHGMLKGIPKVPGSANRSKYIFDSTALTAIERLGSGIEALIIPQSEYWHGIGVYDLTRDQMEVHELIWAERLRNMLFKVRYDADSGFSSASQVAIRRTVSFGNGFLFVDEDESFAKRAIIQYRYMPLAQCYVAEDHLGVVNTFYRHYVLTASQALSKFRENCPAKLRTAAEHKTDKDKEFTFIHCIQPRGDFGLPGDGVRKAAYGSFHIFCEDRQIVRESGYFEFPVIDFRWLPEQGMTYGEGPVMRALAEIQSINQMAKNELITGEQAVRPAYLVANAGVVNKPTGRPGEIILGGVNAQGQRMVQPMFDGQRLDFATMVLEAKRNQLRDAMYLTLFQVLVQNPQMTATEALIRANEKGELLGPSGARFQQSLSRMIDREMGILSRRGLYAPDSAFVPPPSLQGRETIAQMTSPLDRLRRAKEGEGIMRMLEIISPIAQIDQTVLDELDPSQTLRHLRDIFGAPASIMRDPAAVAEIRAQRQQEQAVAQNAQIAEILSKASKQGSEALVGAREGGLV